MLRDNALEALDVVEGFIKEKLEGAVEGSERYKAEEAGFALIVLKSEMAGMDIALNQVCNRDHMFRADGINATPCPPCCSGCSARPYVGHPSCSYKECDWQLSCKHKAEFGRSPDVCPHRS